MPSSPYARYFSRALAAQPERLHFAAHSHHPWPDVSREAHVACWDEAVAWLDDKWERAVGPRLAAAQTQIARLLNLSDPRSLVLAPNTHELVTRLLSCFPLDRPLRVLTSDSEFHSLRRSLDRYAEEKNVWVERVPQAPIDSLDERLCRAMREGVYDLLMLSQVFYNSGLETPNLNRIIHEAKQAGLTVLIDGYHAFAAIPTDLAPWEGSIFYVAGGYKYAQAGEGVCFMHVPPACQLRPLNTGWFSEFGALAGAAKPGELVYGQGGQRFAGATFDPSGAYRLAAIWEHWQGLGLGVPEFHAYVMTLKDYFLNQWQAQQPSLLAEAVLMKGQQPHRAHFLSLQTPQAGKIHAALQALGIVTDYRADRLRFGFGIYQDTGMIDALFARLAKRADA